MRNTHGDSSGCYAAGGGPMRNTGSVQRGEEQPERLSGERKMSGMPVAGSENTEICLSSYE